MERREDKQVRKSWSKNRCIHAGGGGRNERDIIPNRNNEKNKMNECHNEWNGGKYHPRTEMKYL